MMKLPVLLYLCAGLASATTFTVTRTIDRNLNCLPTACSLREAIIAANRDATATAANPHVVNVPAGKYLLTILGPRDEDAAIVGDLDISDHRAPTPPNPPQRP